MSDLTQKQENFCIAYLETGNASEAYRRAYDCEKSSDQTIWVNAHRVLHDTKVQLRLDELRRDIIEAARCTFEGHLSKLAWLRDKAAEKEQYSAAIKAEESRGKVAGLYKDQIDLSSSDGSMRPQAIELIGVIADEQGTATDTE